VCVWGLIGQTTDRPGDRSQVDVQRLYVGNYMTALDMAGFSLSVLQLDDARTQRLDAAVQVPKCTPARPVPPVQAGHSFQQRVPWCTVAAVKDGTVSTSASARTGRAAVRFDVTPCRTAC
jgi:Dak1 domain